MSKEKQIEEIANVIYDDPNSYDTYWRSHCEQLAETIYNAGYRKHREAAWRFAGYSLTGQRAYQCTNCGFAVANIDDVNMKFCPNCGAKMKGSGE